ncbi:hypothetical protein [Neorhizobium sp. NCHU2750]|uniref:hypothetical protein n=1 Tax=Neorhizobium sp. NCHU2750 TaxID=1825976 RepID=UPI000E70FE84|nr:hypothetical protein NCHU2750_05460 [Neorhizobium sp. NCHU2750]
MINVLDALVRLSDIARSMAPPVPLLALSAVVLAVILVNMSLGEMLKSRILAYRDAEDYHHVILRLYQLFDWPAFSLFQPRRRDRSSAVDAIGLFAGAVLGLFLFVFVTIALVMSGDGISRPLGQSAIAIVYLVATVAFARASMIGAVKQWYGIR